MSTVLTPPDETSAGAGPYIGLTNFAEEHAALFFGRDAERKVLISNLRASRLTLLHAESGVGKSSLLRAGVAARLRAFAQKTVAAGGIPAYVPVVFSSWRDDPTGDLIREIRATVASFEPRSPIEPHTGLHATLLAANAALREPDETDCGATILVILDQFEEYFTYRMREHPRGRFVEELARCINARDVAANFLIAIREDAYAGLGDLFQGRIDNIYGNFLALDNLDRRSAREAIELPIAQYNAEHPDAPQVGYEAELVDAVLDQLCAERFASDQSGKGTVNANKGAGSTDDIPAPYLQLVMQRLWQEDAGHEPYRLRLATLERLRGANTIVRTHVDRALSGLPSHDRETAFDIFRHLVTPSGTKIALGPSDLADYSKEPEPEIERLLERLTASDARILRAVPPPRHSEGSRYEITHDLLAPAILEWRTRERAVRLEREKQEAEQRIHVERRRARRFRALAIGAVVLTLAAIAATVLALHFASTSNTAQEQAEESQQIAESRRLAASAEAQIDRDPELATLLSLEAVKQPQVADEAVNALRDSLPRLQLRETLSPPVPLRSVAYTRDGRRIVAGLADGRVGIWDAASGRQLATLPSFGVINSAAVSPSGDRIVTAGNDGTAHVLDARTGRLLTTLRPKGGAALTSAVFSPDGKRIATGGADGIARTWDAAGAREIAHNSSERHHVVMSAAFSPDGKRVVIASASAHVRIWDAATGAQIADTEDSTGVITARFSPDGKRVVIGGGAADVSIWDPAKGETLQDIDTADDGGMNFGVDYSPDGRRFASANGDGVARVWDATTHKLVRSVGTPRTDSLAAVAFSPDGRTLATASAGGELHLWDAASGRHKRRLDVPPGGNVLRAATFNHDGTMIAAASRFGTVTLYERHDVGKGQVRWDRVNVISAPQGDAVNDVAFDPQSVAVATAHQSGRWYVWTLPDGELYESAYDSFQPLNSIKFDPRDAFRFVAAGDEGAARVYELASDKVVGPVMKSTGHEMHVATFSPDGKRILTGSDDGVRVWSTSTHRKIGSGDTWSTSPSYGAAWRPNGREYSLGSDNGISYGFTARTQAFVSQYGQRQPTTIRSISYSADGELVVTAGTDSKARVWGAETGNLLLTLSGHDGPIDSAQFSPVDTELLTASADGTAKLWEAAPIEQKAQWAGRGDFPNVYTAAFDPVDGRKVVAAGSEQTRVYDVAKPAAKPVRFGPSDLLYSSSAQYSHDGKRVVTTDGETQVMIWDADKLSKPLVSFHITSEPRCSHRLTTSAQILGSATFDSTGERIVTADYGGSACVWEWRTQKLIRRFNEPGGVTAGATGASGVSASGMRWAVFSPDDKTVLTANDNGTARIWSMDGDDHWLRAFHAPAGAAINSAWFSRPDGKRMVTASSDGAARIWNVEDGSLERVLHDPENSEVYNAVFSPDGRYVATCSGAARIWDADTGRPLTQFRYGDTLSDCEFSPDGKQLVTGGNDGTTRVFSLELGVASLDDLKQMARQRVTRGLTAAEKRTYLTG